LTERTDPYLVRLASFNGDNIAVQMLIGSWGDLNDLHCNLSRFISQKLFYLSSEAVWKCSAVLNNLGNFKCYVEQLN